MRNTSQGKNKANFGGRLTIDGYQGPKGYPRIRVITLDLPPDQVEAMWSAYEAGGQKALLEWVNGRGDEYVQGWSVDRLDDLRWDS